MTDGPVETCMSPVGFYASDPSDYFRDRLSMLAVRAGAGTRLAALVADGVSWGPIRLAATSPPELDVSLGAGEAGAAAASISIETCALLREVSVTLIVHFLAHADAGGEPWVAAPRLVQSGAWTARLPDLAAEKPREEVLAAVAEVFLGGERSTPTTGWLEARGASVRLLGVVARGCLDDGAVARTTLALASETDPTSPDAVAATQHQAWLIHLANNQLRVLWKVARQRHLGVTHDGLDLVTNAAIDVLAPGDRS